MSNQRAPGQKLINLYMSEEFIAEIDREMRLHGYSERSRFVRDAVYEKLRSLGIVLPAEISMAPSRTLQRQAAKLGYGQTPSGAVQMNDGKKPFTTDGTDNTDKKKTLSPSVKSVKSVVKKQKP